MSDKAKAALWYATKKNWRIVPCHTVKDGSCSCSKGATCKSAGKHPRTENGSHDGTTDPTIISKYWERWPDANIGLVLGPESGTMGLDIDPRHGGDESLKELVAENGDIPDTIRSITGGKGEHILLQHPQTKITSTVGIKPGIDVRADNTLMILPPSTHSSGNKYAWNVDHRPDCMDVAAAPDWLLKFLATNNGIQKKPLSLETVIPAGKRNDILFRFGCKLRRQGMSREEIRSALVSLNNSRCSSEPNDPIPDEKEIEAIVESVFRYQVGILPNGDFRKNAQSEFNPRTWNYSLEQEALHGLPGQIVRTFGPHTEADEVAILGQLLICFGNIVGRNPYFKVESTHHGLNSFLVLVGESAKARKGTSLDHVLRLMEDVDPEWINCRESGLSSGEGLIARLRDRVEKTDETGKSLIVDEGVKDKRLLVVESEFASVLRTQGREGNTLSAILRDGWDGRRLSCLTKNNRLKASEPHLSLICHITAGELVRYLTDTEAGNGYGNRFWWLYVRRSKILPLGGLVPLEKIGELQLKLREAFHFAQNVREIVFDEEARAFWFSVYEELSTPSFGLLGAITARAEAQVIRMASIYACLDLSNKILMCHLKAALALWKYSLESCKFIFGERLGDPVADTIFEALLNSPEGLSRTAIRDLFHRNKGRDEIGRALGSLLSAGRVYMRAITGGGRDTEMWLAKEAVART